MDMKNLIVFSLFIGMTLGLFGSIYDPLELVFAQRAPDQIDYWRGKVDTELKQVDGQFLEIKHQLEKMNRKIDSICDDVVNVRVKAAELGSIYGGGASVIVFLGGLFIKGLAGKWKKNGKAKI